MRRIRSKNYVSRISKDSFEWSLKNIHFWLCFELSRETFEFEWNKTFVWGTHRKLVEMSSHCCCCTAFAVTQYTASSSDRDEKQLSHSPQSHTAAAASIRNENNIQTSQGWIQHGVWERYSGSRESHSSSLALKIDSTWPEENSFICHKLTSIDT